VLVGRVDGLMFHMLHGSPSSSSVVVIVVVFGVFFVGLGKQKIPPPNDEGGMGGGWNPRYSGFCFLVWES
jgi:hypothetical protein